jgi:hypothetical protein
MARANTESPWEALQRLMREAADKKIQSFLSAPAPADAPESLYFQRRQELGEELDLGGSESILLRLIAATPKKKKEAVRPIIDFQAPAISKVSELQEESWTPANLNKMSYKIDANLYGNGAMTEQEVLTMLGKTSPPPPAEEPPPPAPAESTRVIIGGKRRYRP